MHLEIVFFQRGWLTSRITLHRESIVLVIKIIMSWICCIECFRLVIHWDHRPNYSIYLSHCTCWVFYVWEIFTVNSRTGLSTPHFICLFFLGASPQESESLLTDEVKRNLSQSVFISSQFTRGCTTFPHMQSTGPITTWSGSGGSGQRADDVYLSGYPSTVGCEDHHCHHSSDGILLLGEEHQPNVAHVASGVIISKNPLNPHPTHRHSTGNGASRRNITSAVAPPLPPPLPDSARARHEARATTQLCQTLPANFPATASTLMVGSRSVLDETDSEEAVPSVAQKSLPRHCRRHQTAGSYHHRHQHQSHHNCHRLMPVTSDASIASCSGPCPPGPSPGVFTADEDLWDTDTGTAPPVTSSPSSTTPASLTTGSVPNRSVPSVSLPNSNALSASSTSTRLPCSFSRAWAILPCWLFFID